MVYENTLHSCDIILTWLCLFHMAYVCSQVEHSAFPYLALLLHEGLQSACFIFY